MFLPVRSKFARYLSVLLLAILAGCASGPKMYEIRGEADPVVNRDTTGAPLSVVVRLYQLKDSTEFSKLTFDTLASGRPESDLLGPELLEKNEVVLVPGNKHSSTDKLREDTKYIGIVAFFRRPDPNYWRYLVDADKVRSDGLTFRVQDCYLTLLNVKPVPIPGQPVNGKPTCPIVQAQPQGQPQAAQESGAAEQPAQQKQGQSEKNRKARHSTAKRHVRAAKRALTPAVIDVGLPYGGSPARPLQ
jgi:type VI secretion system protein VasD